MSVCVKSRPTKSRESAATVAAAEFYNVLMALKIKHALVERLAYEVARLTGETKTEAIRKSLEERKRRLNAPSIAERRKRVLRFLEHDIWPTIPKDQLGRRLTRKEEDDIVGYRPDGV